ncbi:hypothetical protein [Parabacteroides sp. FAFU027]|uniref:hypothetical protein n=1 Tax=Parabacteroides sp. FAFU027 TaxID=2922715 RepID=UPI001FAEF278|nr:hypothetical protein [Parabacteroides sp. FAFU027]
MKKKQNGRVTMADYVKAMKRANREMELQNSTGFKAVTRIHKSKKAYNRRDGKRTDFDTFSSFFSGNSFHFIYR